MTDFLLPVRRKAYNLDHLAKLREILTRILDFLQSIANSVGLVDNLKNRIAHCGLVEQIIHGRHLY
jgi:hypothetical protein